MESADFPPELAKKNETNSSHASPNGIQSWHEGPFLFVTHEGSPILNYVGAEIAELASTDLRIQVDDLHRPTGFVIGHKLEIKLFEPLRK